MSGIFDLMTGSSKAGSDHIAHMERVKTSTVINVQSTNMQTIDHKLYQFHYKIHFSFTEETFNCAPLSYQLISVVWYKMVVGRNSC